MHPITNKKNYFGILLTGILLLIVLKPAQTAEPAILTITIEGVEGRLRANVEAHLGINRLAGEPIPSESRLRWLHARAEDEIRRALQPFGYYRPTIDTELEQTAEGWQARYRIAPGQPARIATVDLRVSGEGANDPTFKRIQASLPLTEGDVLEHRRYEDIKQALQSVAAERGYFDARLLTSEIRVDLQANSAFINLHFDTGDRYRLGQITFHQDTLAPEFLHRYLNFQPGDPYRASALLNLQSALIDSEYFSRVEVNAPLDRAEDEVIPVDIYLEPLRPRRYTVGLGYGTDTGVRGRFSVEARRVNRRGHRYRINLLGSQIRYSLTGEYIIPGADPRTDSYALRTGFSGEDSDVKDSQTALIGVSWQRQEGRWLKVRSLDYQWERFRFGDEEQTTTLLIPRFNWTRVVPEDRLYVTEGSSISLELRGAHDALLSDVTFIQGAARGKWIKTLTEDQDGRIILRGELGTTAISQDFDRLPASLRFFAGGDRSVRGYSLDSIGPRNEADDVIGGKHLVVGSLEYEHRILENWSVAAFVDSGDAFDDTVDLKTGVGFGVRWLSPVGAVRVDLASGLDEPGDTIRLHLSIGPDL